MGDLTAIAMARVVLFLVDIIWSTGVQICIWIQNTVSFIKHCLMKI